MNMSLTKTGILNHAVLGKIWKAPLYPPDCHRKCLACMRDLGLSFPCEGDDGQDYLPSLLLSHKPDFQLIWFGDDVRVEYDRTWKFSFVPLGLLHQYISRMMELTQIHSIWEYGCVLSMKSDWALIEEIPSLQIIRITVRSSFKDTPLLGFLLEMMEQLLLNYFPAHEPLKVYVRCSHCISQVEADLVTEFAVESLESALLNGQSTVTCTRTGTAMEIASLAPDLALLQFSSFRIPLSEIERESQKLAEGAYGILYRGVYKGEPIAIKLLRLKEVAGEEQIAIFREFRREVSLMAGLRNENIVELRGFCFGDGDMGLVMDLVNSGDLHGLIKEKGRSMAPTLYLKLAFDIAQGLHFLHSLPTPILHRDLKPPNILLSGKPGTNEYVAQLADFGLSAHQYFPVLRERAVETPMWVAPEILSGGAYTSKSDVYAFGIILYEMTEGKMPFDSLDFDFRFLNQLEDEIISGKRGDLTLLEASNPNVAQLIRSCWQSDPHQRPTCQQIMLMILSIAQNYAPALYKQLTPRYKQVTLKEKLPGTRLQGVGTLRATSTTVEGKLLKRLQTNPAETVNCMILAGGDIWVAHRNGDISIWNSESGKLFRQIVAAHSREIQTMILVDNRVWTGSKDGMIRIWKARHLDDASSKSNETAKEGYLEPGDGSPAVFVSLKNGSKELIPHIPLLLSRTTAINEPKTGFNILLTDTSNHKFYCANPKDRDEWVHAINYVAQNLCEETEDLSVGQIPPRKRRDQIHSLVYANGFVYVGISELVIRSYDANNLQFHGEHSITLESTWTAPKRTSKRDLSSKSFAQMPSTSRKQIASVNFGKQRGQEAPTPLTKKPQQLEEHLQVVSLLHLGNRYLWVVVQSFILRFSLEDVQPRGQLLGHEDQINALCNVGEERLWSISDDKHIRVWDTKAMQCVRILSLPGVGFSLLHAGNTVWCGVGRDIQIYNGSNYTLQSTLHGEHTEPITWMIIVWNRIVWSSSEDKTICVWA